VLTEPFSVVEKAIAEATQLQLIRLPDSSASRDWVSGKRCLVAGLGPVGLLAAAALLLRGAEVWGLDVVDASTVRPCWLESVGGHYIDGRQITPEHFIDKIKLFDLILEATGIASLEFDLIDALAINGVYVVTGIPSGDRPLKIDGEELMRRLVLRNQVVLGSVNASRNHFQLAVNDLAQAQTRWHEHVAQLITNRYEYSDFDHAFQHHDADEIKVVLRWSADRTAQPEKVKQLAYHEA
jgi:threonine dehydrogenase-like Zn-dependent dehydrogenase